MELHGVLAARRFDPAEELDLLIDGEVLFEPHLQQARVLGQQVRLPLLLVDGVCLELRVVVCSVGL